MRRQSRSGARRLRREQHCLFDSTRRGDLDELRRIRSGYQLRSGQQQEERIRAFDRRGETFRIGEIGPPMPHAIGQRDVVVAAGYGGHLLAGGGEVLHEGASDIAGRSGHYDHCHS